MTPSPWAEELRSLCVQLGELTHNYQEASRMLTERMRLLAAQENAWRQAMTTAAPPPEESTP
jgi:hypothetical protein